MSSQDLFEPQPIAGTYKTVQFTEPYVNPKVTYVSGKEPVYLISEGYLTDTFSRIQGKVLTVVEAISESKERREAIKSLMRQAVWDEARELSLMKLEKIS